MKKATFFIGIMICIANMLLAQSATDILKLEQIKKYQEADHTMISSKPETGPIRLLPVDQVSTGPAIRKAERKISAACTTETNGNVRVFPVSTDVIFDEQFQFPCAVEGGEQGLETDGSFIYSSKWNGDAFYVYSLAGDYQGEFSVPGVSNIRDLAFDGTYFYGSDAGTTLYQMEFDGIGLCGILISTMETPTDVRAIAYDEDSDGFYANNYDSEITLFDRSGNTLNSFWCGEYANYYGFAWVVCNDAPYLWGFSKDGGGATLVEMSLPDGEETGTTFDAGIYSPDGNGICGGLFIHPNLVLGTYTIGGMIQIKSSLVLNFAMPRCRPTWICVLPLFPNPTADLTSVWKMWKWWFKTRVYWLKAILLSDTGSTAETGFRILW